MPEEGLALLGWMERNERRWGSEIWRAESMAAPGELDIEYVDARRVLLDALVAIGPQTPTSFSTLVSGAISRRLAMPCAMPGSIAPTAGRRSARPPRRPRQEHGPQEHRR